MPKRARSKSRTSTTVKSTKSFCNGEELTKLAYAYDAKGLKRRLATVAKLNVRDKKVGEAFFAAAALDETCELVDMFLARGLDINIRVNRKAMLPFVMRMTSTRRIRGLLERGIDVNGRIRDGVTPIIAACKYGAESLDLEARPKLMKNVALVIAAGADVNARDSFRRTALDFAVQGGWPEMAKQLLDAGAKLEETREGAWFLLEDSVRAWRPRDAAKLVTMMLAAGADPKYVDKFQRRTALMLAAFMGRPKVAKILVKAGADPNTKNGSGKTALDLAIERQGQENNSQNPDYDRVIAYLRKITSDIVPDRVDSQRRKSRDRRPPATVLRIKKKRQRLPIAPKTVLPARQQPLEKIISIEGLYKISIEHSARRNVEGVIAMVGRLLGTGASAITPESREVDAQVARVAEHLRKSADQIAKISLRIDREKFVVSNDDGEDEEEDVYRIVKQTQESPETAVLEVKRAGFGRMRWKVTLLAGTILIIEAATEDIGSWVFERTGASGKPGRVANVKRRGKK